MAIFSTPTVFAQPGVNPQSMNRHTSGDTVIIEERPGVRLVGVIDGAWVRGFEKLEASGIDVANWSSSTIGTILSGMMLVLPHQTPLKQVIGSAVEFYPLHLEKLRNLAGYNIQPPSAYSHVDIAKVMPQSAGAIALQHGNGTLEISQWRDCLVVAEGHDGTMQRLTPNQSELVAEATKSLQYQHEGLNAYQPVVKEALDRGDSYGTIRETVRGLAAKAHKPMFFEIWRNAEAQLPETLTGTQGFETWRNTFDTLCLFQNSSLMLNNPEAPEVLLKNGTTTTASWAMLTGERAMMPLTFNRRFTPEQAAGIKALWLMSDGAFKQGDRGQDLKAMQAMGAERYYDEVLLRRFDGSKPTNRRFADDRVPMDVTIVRVPLNGRDDNR